MAVKLVPVDDADSGTVERFRREVAAVANLDHPHVVPVHDAGEHEGLLVLVMRLVDGPDLRALVAREGRLDPGRAVRLVAEVGSALDAAHVAGLVHRDVKPGNVLVAGGPPEHAYLADFGLVRTYGTGEQTMTGPGQWVGTPAYASPEQRAGGRVGPAADRYALAGVLAFLVTGHAPGGGLGPSSRPGDPRAAALLAVAEAGMANRPEDRFPTAAAMVAAARDAVSRAAADPTDPTDPTATDPAPSSQVDEDADRADVPPRGGAGDRADPTVPTGRIGPPVHDAVEHGVGGSRTGRPRGVVALAVVVALLLAAGAAGGYLLLRGAGAADDRTGTPSGAPSAAGSPSSSPAAAPEDRLPELAPGSRGRLVRAAQQLLRGSGAEVDVTGRYDDATSTAVTALQQDRGIRPADGSLTAGTWFELFQTLSRGDRGPAVEAAQTLLNAGQADLELDGIFGPRMSAAVLRFQQSRGLAADGVVGANTWRELVARA